MWSIGTRRSGARALDWIIRWAKSRIIALLGKSPAGRRIWFSYVDLTFTKPTLRHVRREISALMRVVNQDATMRTRLVHNNSVSPPTYGNFLEVVMLARYLALTGFEIDFFVVDCLKGRPEWKSRGLGVSYEDEFVQDQIKLARLLLPESAVVHLVEHSEIANVCASSETAHTLFNLEVLREENITAQCVYLLHELVVSSGSSLPLGFLLDRSQFSFSSNAEPRMRPYIAWHVRRGAWDHERDSVDSVLREDFSELRRRFPEHTIMLFSTESGTEYAMEALSGLCGASDFDAGSPILERQPDNGFVSAIPWVLGADFYYQRLGGGAGWIALFSHLPYLMVLGDVAYFEGIRKDCQVMPWARENQRCLVLPSQAGRVRLAEVINLT